MKKRKVKNHPAYQKKTKGVVHVVGSGLIALTINHKKTKQRLERNNHQ